MAPEPLQPPSYPMRPRRRRNSSAVGWIAALAVVGVLIAFAVLATAPLSGPASGDTAGDASSVAAMPVPVSSAPASSAPAMMESSSAAAVMPASSAAPAPVPVPAPSSASTRSAESGLSASRTVVTFYNDWATFKGSPMKAAHYEGSPYITESLRAALRNHADAAIDPVVCAAKDPPAFEVVGVKQQGSAAATGTVRETYAEGTVDVAVTLKSEGGMWKIDTITCPSEPMRPVGKLGEFCGGIANLQCAAGLTCKLEGNYPDAGGKCMQ